MRAASAGKMEMVKFLIEDANAGVDIVNVTDGNTALLYAVDKNHHEIVEYLLEHGANIQHRNLVSYTISYLMPSIYIYICMCTYRKEKMRLPSPRQKMQMEELPKPSSGAIWTTVDRES